MHLRQEEMVLGKGPGPCREGGGRLVCDSLSVVSTSGVLSCNESRVNLPG